MPRKQADPPAAPKRPRGRPKGSGMRENARRVNLYLQQATIDRLDAIGDGNISLGVQRAVEAMK